MSDETTPDLTALLAEHWDYDLDHDGDHWLCDCGEQIGNRQTPDLDMSQRAHLAEQITAAGFGPLRAAEAERDAARAARDQAIALADEMREIASARFDLGVTLKWRARAESAEAALAGLREGVDALSARWRDGLRYKSGPYVRGEGDCSDSLRALLAPTPDREEERDV